MLSLEFRAVNRQQFETSDNFFIIKGVANLAANNIWRFCLQESSLEFCPMTRFRILFFYRIHKNLNVLFHMDPGESPKSTKTHKLINQLIII